MRVLRAPRGETDWGGRRTNPFWGRQNPSRAKIRTQKPLFQVEYITYDYHRSSDASVRTEGIKYAGSKLKLLPYILELAGELPGVQTVLDGFSGTTRVAQALAKSGYTLTANDTADWSGVFAACYLLADKPDEFYQNSWRT